MCLHRALVGLLGATFMVALSVSKPESQARYRLPGPLAEVAARLRSQDKSERQQGFLAARNLRLRVVKDAITALEEALGWQPDPRAPWGMPWSPESTAIMTLGELRASEGVLVLIKCLGKGWVPTEAGPDPAQLALVKIGLPAKDPLIEFLSAEGRTLHETRVAVQTLALICGRGGASFYLEEAMVGETDAKKKRNLQAALQYLQKDQK